MLTSRLPLLALLACLAAMFVAGPAQAQAPATPATQTVAMTGKDKNGKTFKGTYTIDHFRAVGSKVYAVGTLKGTLKNRKVTRENLSIPASLAGDPAAAGGARSAQLACKVLTLTLGPLDLNLLGLRVQLNQVNLRITAIPGGGLLGDLLCSLTNLLNPTGLLGNQLAAILNSLFALLPPTPAAP